MIRGSLAGRFGNWLQWFGAVQAEGLSVPRIRSFIPAGTWLVADPVCTATQFHGWAVAHSVVGEPGRPCRCSWCRWGRSPWRARP